MTGNRLIGHWFILNCIKYICIIINFIDNDADVLVKTKKTAIISDSSYYIF